MRGGVPGRHRASKSSAYEVDARSAVILAAQGSIGGASAADPGPAVVTSPLSFTICWPFQTPLKSGFPSLRRGVGPAGPLAGGLPGVLSGGSPPSSCGAAKATIVIDNTVAARAA